MTRNQLPEGVGKKIVEALKRQAEADVTPIAETETSLGASVPLTDIQELPEVGFEPLAEEVETETIVEEDNSMSIPLGAFPVKEEPAPQQQEYYFEKPVYNEINETKVEQTYTPVTPVAPVAQQSMVNVATGKVSMPSNVAMLKSLISTLPVGVTKQTGAQIIRQTLEATGIPMNTVLKEAQEMQEELNSSTRECMMRIQEYKSNILQLEQSVNEYQKNITQINDLISLFLLTDRK
ncbi:MAG: hypothetical protein IJY61_00605 [Candidatus Gastranaerophilales bacterium]|nr:hypothetical protein [Candidatus Gastranaerophilales bacterium]